MGAYKSDREQDLVDAIAATLRAQRAGRRLTREQVYGPAHMGRSTYQHFENGTRVPDIDQLGRIARVFDLTLTQLVEKIEAWRPGGDDYVRARSTSPDE